MAAYSHFCHVHIVVTIALPASMNGVQTVIVVACGYSYFRCVSGGRCLPSYRRCNRRCDCPYCTDELNCYTPPRLNTTIPPDYYTTTWQPWYTSSHYRKLTPVFSQVNRLSNDKKPVPINHFCRSLSATFKYANTNVVCCWPGNQTLV